MSTPAEHLQQEMLRKKVNPAKCIDNLQQVSSILQENWRTLSHNQIDALKNFAQVNNNLLQFGMPTLKATEISAAPAAPVKFILNVGGKKEEVAVPTKDGD